MARDTVGTEHRVASDGVLDLMWFPGRLVVAGADTRSAVVRTRPGEATWGLRLAPGLAHRAARWGRGGAAPSVARGRDPVLLRRHRRDGGGAVRHAPGPGRPLRALLDPRAVSDDLDRLARAQLPDGGWPVDFAAHSEAAALEWRGRATLAAVEVLPDNGR
ncbi:hypothetical protein AB0910_14555 [Streptomyces sp. NPDC047002]|uniref:hypothetical protein n=1 Tax=Streptomyces sp. NPDC047002 TaxID=3155475 RepID=UPI00345447E5